MPTVTTLALFALASLALLAIPGPVVLYTVARSLQGGRRAGFASCGGVALGDFVHVLAAAVGLSALLLSSALAFQIVKFAGAAYLIFLGIKTLLDRSGDAGLPDAAPRPRSQVFRQGIVVAALNPKTALFFLAFLPQFIDPARGAVGGQALILGSLFVALGLALNSAFAAIAGTLGGWLRGNARFWRGQRYIAGTIYLGLGATAALTGHTRP